MRWDMVWMCAFLLSALACSPGEFLLAGPINISIDIEPGLKDSIQIVSADGKKPGTTNPVETTIVLKMRALLGND